MIVWCARTLRYVVTRATRTTRTMRRRYPTPAASYIARWNGQAGHGQAGRAARLLERRRCEANTGDGVAGGPDRCSGIRGEGCLSTTTTDGRTDAVDIEFRARSYIPTTTRPPDKPLSPRVIVSAAAVIVVVVVPWTPPQAEPYARINTTRRIRYKIKMLFPSPPPPPYRHDPPFVFVYKYA